MRPIFKAIWIGYGNRLVQIAFFYSLLMSVALLVLMFWEQEAADGSVVGINSVDALALVAIVSASVFVPTLFSPVFRAVRSPFEPSLLVIGAVAVLFALSMPHFLFLHYVISDIRASFLFSVFISMMFLCLLLTMLSTTSSRYPELPYLALLVVSLGRFIKPDALSPWFVYLSPFSDIGLLSAARLVNISIMMVGAIAWIGIRLRRVG